MKQVLKNVLASKLKTRKDLANLPFEKKLEIMEKMRERSALLAKNSLRNQKH
jgi:phenylacetate-coenzyme A ligase PaaK-like adenylate-forming protein